jgi:hypothetical protein
MSPQVTYEWTFALGVGVPVVALSRAPVTLPPQLARAHLLAFEPGATPPWGLLIRVLVNIQNRSRPAEGRASGLGRRPESDSEPPSSVFRQLGEPPPRSWTGCGVSRRPRRT